MRQAGICVWQAHQLVRQIVAPGVTTADIDAVVAEHFRRCGAQPLFKNYPHQNSGRPPFPAATCTSVNEEVVHGIPNHRPLRRRRHRQRRHRLPAQRLVRRRGRTPIRSAASPPPCSGCSTSPLATLDLAFELMHTKSRWSQVAREMAQFVRDHGFSTVECFVGHGIGRQMHEEPQVPNFLSRSLRGSGDFRIEPGLVIAVEPMVNMGTKRVKMHARPLDAVDARPQAERPFRAHDCRHERRPGAADRRPRRRTKLAKLPWEFAAAALAAKPRAAR